MASETKPKSRILCIGFYSKGNCGDELYKIIFPKLFPDIDFRFTNDVKEQDVTWADNIVLGGGNVIDRNFLGKISIVPRNKKIFGWSVGCTDRSILRAELLRFAHIWTRDDGTARLLTKQRIEHTLGPDAAWLIESNRERGLSLWKESFCNNELYQKRVSVVLNAHITSSQPDLLARDAYRFQNFASDMSRICDDTSASFAFVPFGHDTPWDDRAPNSWVAHKCKWHRKNKIVYDNWSVQDTIDFLSASDVVVSMRYHSTVFSMICGVPFIDISHHDKNLGLLAQHGFSDLSVSYWDFSRDKTKKMLDSMLTDPSYYRVRIQSAFKDARKNLLATSNKIRSLISWE